MMMNFRRLVGFCMTDKYQNPHSVGCKSPHLERLIIVDLRINETLQPGAVRKPHLPGGASVFLFCRVETECSA